VPPSTNRKIFGEEIQAPLVEQSKLALVQPNDDSNSKSSFPILFRLQEDTCLRHELSEMSASENIADHEVNELNTTAMIDEYITDLRCSGKTVYDRSKVLSSSVAMSQRAEMKKRPYVNGF
jgi:hypothetical protein